MTPRNRSLREQLAENESLPRPPSPESLNTRTVQVWWNLLESRPSQSCYDGLLFIRGTGIPSSMWVRIYTRILIAHGSLIKLEIYAYRLTRIPGAPPLKCFCTPRFHLLLSHTHTYRLYLHVAQVFELCHQNVCVFPVCHRGTPWWSSLPVLSSQPPRTLTLCCD